MISILIPVFNYDINELIVALSNQAGKLGQESEIIVIDDGSQSSYRNLNAAIASLPFVQYIESEKNNGRVRIRQMLADKASFEWLLFLDCDSQILSDHYLEIYVQRIRDSVQIMSGGRVYSREKPTDCRFTLHWKYGTYREKTTYNSKNHTNRFMTNNFLIRKSIFVKFHFTPDWGGYGYEDTWIGIQLEAMNIAVSHIDNPVLHNGLQESLEFLSKSREALKNLKKLSQVVPVKILAKHVKLYLYYYRLKYLGLLWLLRFIYSMTHTGIEKNIHSCNPSLFKFDLWRLNYFLELHNADHKNLVSC